MSEKTKINKKPSMGVIICGGVVIVLGLLISRLSSWNIGCFLLKLSSFVKSAKIELNLYDYVAGLIVFVIGVSYIAGGVGILMLRYWAQRLIVLASTLFISGYFIDLVAKGLSEAGEQLAWSVMFSPILILPILFIIFLTHPKVKEQFK